MKTRQELTEVPDFIAEYASCLLGPGVHTPRVLNLLPMVLCLAIGVFFTFTLLHRFNLYADI